MASRNNVQSFRVGHPDHVMSSARQPRGRASFPQPIAAM
jgi:hypothetical protein